MSVLVAAPPGLVSLKTAPTDEPTGKRAKWKSASQIATFELCRRKWAFRTIEGVKGSNRFAERGTAYHDVIEPWLLHGTPIPDTEIGKRILAGIRFLPKPGVAEVEREFWLRSPSATYVGKVDWAFQDRLWVIGDNKTTTDIKWALTAEKLLVDVQAMTYATEAFVRFPEIDELELRWTYFQARGARKSLQVRHENGDPVIVTRSHALEQFARIDAIAAEMVAIELSGARAMDLPPNAAACDAFGGCPYRGTVCNLTPAERMKSIMAQESLRERLARRNAQKNAGIEGPQKSATAAGKTLPMVQRRQADPINPPERPVLPAAGEELDPVGVCTCGAEVALDANGRLKPHRRKGAAILCPGAGKAPLPPAAAEEALAEGVEEERAVDPGAEAEALAAQAHEEAEAAAAKVTPLAARAAAAASKKQANVARTTTPERVSAPDAAAGELSPAEENAMVIALLEEFDPGVLRAARAAVKRLRGM